SVSLSISILPSIYFTAPMPCLYLPLYPSITLTSGAAVVQEVKKSFSHQKVARSIPIAHVTTVACPYKEQAGRLCLQIQVHENALSISETSSGEHSSEHFCCVRTHFQAFINPADMFFLRCFSEARKK